MRSKIAKRLFLFILSVLLISAFLTGCDIGFLWPHYEDFYRYDTYLNDEYIDIYSDDIHNFMENEIPKITGYDSVLYTFATCTRAGIMKSLDCAVEACTVTYAFHPDSYQQYQNLHEQIQLCADGFPSDVIIPYCEIEDLRVYVLYEEERHYPKNIKTLLLNDVNCTVSFCCIYETSLDSFSFENDYKDWIATNTCILVEPDI